MNFFHSKRLRLFMWWLFFNFRLIFSFFTFCLFLLCDLMDLIYLLHLFCWAFWFSCWIYNPCRFKVFFHTPITNSLFIIFINIFNYFPTIWTLVTYNASTYSTVMSAIEEREFYITNFTKRIILISLPQWSFVFLIFTQYIMNIVIINNWLNLFSPLWHVFSSELWLN